MLNTDAVINFRGDGSELESTLKKLGVGFSKLNEGVSDGSEHITEMGKQSGIAEKLLGKLSGTASNSRKAVSGLSGAFGDVSDTIEGTNSALKTTVKVTDVTGNWAVQLGSKFLGMGKQVDFLNSTLGPVADSFSSVMEQGTVAGKIFKTLDIAQKPLSSGLRTAAKATSDFAERLEQMGIVGEGAAKVVNQLSGGLIKFSNAVNLADQVGDIHRLSEGIQRFAEEDLSGVLESTGTALTTVSQKVIPMISTPMALATTSARAITISYGALTKNANLLKETLDALGSKGASAIRLLGQGMSKVNLPEGLTKQTEKLADGLENLTDKSSKAGRSLEGVGENFKKAGLNDVAGKFLGILALKQSLDMLNALGVAAMDAYMKMQGLNTAFQAMQSIGIDSTTSEMAVSLGMMGEGLLLSSQAAEKFVNVSFQRFAGFQDQLANLATLSVGAAAGQDKLGDALTNLVNGPLQNAISSVEAAKGMYNALSAGVGSIAETTNFMEAATKLSSATGTDAGTTIEALAKSMKVYKIENRDSALVAAKMNQVVERGIVTFPQLAGGIARVSESAKASGVGIDELYGSISALTQTLSADDAMTGYASLLSSIAGQGAQSAKAIEELGIKFDTNTIKTKGLLASLQDLWKATGGSTNKLKEIIPDSLAFSTALSLMTTASKDAKQNMEDMGTVGSESLDTLFDNRRQSATQRMTAVTNGFNEVMTDLGKRTLPAIEPGLKSLEGLLKYFQNLPEPLKDVIAGTAMLSMQFGRVTEAGQSLTNIVLGLGKAYLITRGSQLIMTGEIRTHVEAIRQAIMAKQGYQKALMGVLGVEQVVQKARAGQIMGLEGLKNINDGLMNSFANSRKALNGWAEDFAPMLLSAQQKTLLPAKAFDRMIGSYETLGAAIRKVDQLDLSKFTLQSENLFKSIYSITSPEVQDRISRITTNLRGLDPAIAKGNVAKAMGLDQAGSSLESIGKAEDRLKNFKDTVLAKYPDDTPLKIAMESEVKAIKSNLTSRKALAVMNAEMLVDLDKQSAIASKKKRVQNFQGIEEIFLGGNQDEIRSKIKEGFANATPSVKAEAEKLTKQIAIGNKSEKTKGLMAELLGLGDVKGTLSSVQEAQTKLANIDLPRPMTKQMAAETAAIEFNLAARAKLLALKEAEGKRAIGEIAEIGASTAAKNADTAALATNAVLTEFHLVATGRTTFATKLGALANAVYTLSINGITAALTWATSAAALFWVVLIGSVIGVVAVLGSVLLVLQDFIPALGGAAAESEKMEKALLKAAGATSELTEKQKEGTKEGKAYKGNMQGLIWLLAGTISNIWDLGKGVLWVMGGITSFIPWLLSNVPVLGPMFKAIFGSIGDLMNSVGNAFNWVKDRAGQSVEIIQELTEAATTSEGLISARNAAEAETQRLYEKTLQYRQKLKNHDYITDEAKAIVKANQGKALSSEDLAKVLAAEKKAIDALKATNDQTIADLTEANKNENDPGRKKARQSQIDDLTKQTSLLAEVAKAETLYQTNIAAIANAQASNQAAKSTEKFLDSLNQKTEEGLKKIQELDAERIAKMGRDGQSQEIIAQAQVDSETAQKVYEESMTKFGVFSSTMANAASGSQRRQLLALSSTYDKLSQDMANVGTVDLSILRSNADSAMDQIKKSFDGGAIGVEFATELLEGLQSQKGPIGQNGIAESILSASQIQENVAMIIEMKKTALERSFAMDEKAIGEVRLREKQTVISAEASALQITQIQFEQNKKRLANAKETLALIEEVGKGKDSQEYRDKQAEIVKMEQDLKGQQIEMGNQEIAVRKNVLDQKLRLDEQSNRQVQLLQTKGLITAQEAADQMAGIDIEMNNKRLKDAKETLEKIAKLQGKSSRAYMDAQLEVNKLEMELESQKENREIKRKVIAIEKSQKIFSNQIEAENQGLRIQINALTKIGDELGRQQKVLEARNSLLSLVETQSQASLTNLSRQIKDETIKAEIQTRSASQQLSILERTQEAEVESLNMSQAQQRIANEKQQTESDIALKENQRAIADAEADIAKQQVNAKLTEEDRRSGELRVNALRIQQEQLQNQQLQLRGQEMIMQNAVEELKIKQSMALVEAEINLLLAEQAESEAKRNQEIKLGQQMLGYYQQQINMVTKLTNSELIKTAVESKSQQASLRFLERKQELEKESAKDQERINALALEGQEYDNALQLKENERLINEANLDLTTAASEEEQRMAQSRITSLQKQREFLAGQTSMIGKQQEMNDRAAIELEIRQDQEKSEARLNVLLAKQAEQAALITERMNFQKDILERQKQLMESRSSQVAGELDLLSKTVSKEKDKQAIARATARIKYQSLLSQQEMELRVLDLNQAQQKATMEQEQIRLRMQQAQNKADIADAKAKVSESIAQGDSPEMVQARLDALSAKVEQGAYLQYATEIQTNQAKLTEMLNVQQRQATVASQSTARGNALVEVAETLPGRQRTNLLASVRNQVLADLGLNTGVGSGLGSSNIQGLRNLNLNTSTQGVIPQITPPDLDYIRRNFQAQMQEFGVPQAPGGVAGQRQANDPVMAEIRDGLQAQADRPTNDVSMQNTINITLQANRNDEIGQNVEQQVLQSLDGVLTTLNQRR